MRQIKRTMFYVLAIAVISSLSIGCKAIQWGLEASQALGVGVSTNETANSERGILVPPMDNRERNDLYWKWQDIPFPHHGRPPSERIKVTWPSQLRDEYGDNLTMHLNGQVILQNYGHDHGKPQFEWFAGDSELYDEYISKSLYVAIYDDNTKIVGLIKQHPRKRYTGPLKGKIE